MINKISPNNIFFKGVHKNNIESHNSSKLNHLNHTSHFFRYIETDEFLFSYLKNLEQDSINIASVGCSYDEEPYSYALALIGKPNVQISAFDISKEAIKKAKAGVFELTSYEKFFLTPNSGQEIWHNEMNPERKNLRNAFHASFEKIAPETYKLKNGRLKNCNFFNGEATKTSQYFAKNSQDLILCRNMLYHLSEDEQNEVISQFYEILKPLGLVCLDGDNFASEAHLMRANGFISPFKDFPWIFQKPAQKIDIEDLILNYQIQKLTDILNNKSDFNNI